MLHDTVAGAVKDAIDSLGIKVVSVETEYQQKVGLTMEGSSLCALSKADIIYTLNYKNKLITLYVEASSTRINIAKPWQAILRGIALYYERRIPVGVVVVSPEKIMYKLLEDSDQDKVLKKMRRGSKGFNPSPNLCSLCELQHYCPYRVV